MRGGRPILSCGPLERLPSTHKCRMALVGGIGQRKGVTFVSLRRRCAGGFCDDVFCSEH